MQKIGFCGGTEVFLRFVKNANPEKALVCFKNIKEAVEAALAGEYEALLLLPEAADKPQPTLDWETYLKMSALRNKGQKLYIECYDAGDYTALNLFGFIVDAPMRSFFDEYVVWNNKLLQARNSKYLPGRSSDAKILASIENCLGSHEPTIPSTYKFPLIVQKEGFIYSACAISFFDRLTMLPNSRWCELFGELFGDSFGAEKTAIASTFHKEYPAIGLSDDAVYNREGLENAVLGAVKWHLNSGLIADQSGKSGMYEMIRSMDLSVRANQRVDTLLMTAALFTTAGHYFKDEKLTSCGENLADYGFSKSIQFEVGANDGLFSWFIDSGTGPYAVFSSDNGRVALAMIQLHRITGKQKYLSKLTRQANLFLKWMDGPYFKQTFFSTKEYNIETLPKSEQPSNSPVYYDAPMIMLGYLYKAAGDKRYFNAVKTTAAALYKTYPKYTNNFSPLTHNLLYSRLLMVLLAGQDIGCGDYSDLINELLEFFEKLQSPSGGIADHSLIIDDWTFTHPEFAIGMGEGRDSICDFLYCVNNMLGACSIVRRMNNPLSIKTQCAEKIFSKLCEFVLNKQIRDDDNRLNGGWMRAFDMETNEYYGINRDKDWGPYCIMGGWVMSLIPLVMLSELGEPSIYAPEDEKRSGIE